MIYTVTLNPAVDKEFVVPEIALDEVLRAESTRIDMGGKGFNVSRMLKALGTDSVAVAFAGGHCGALLRDGMYRLGIPTDLLWISGETRANICVVNGRRRQMLKVNEAGPAIRHTDFAALLDRIAELVEPGDWWVMGGSLPPGAPSDSYAQIIALVQARGGRAALDSSGPALAEGCRAAPFLVKPNVLEAGQLSGLPVDTTADLAAAARAVRALGPQHVVISRGAEGALLDTATGTWLAESPAVAAGNPTGAGDALVAGLVWSLARGDAPPEALCWGVACGASTAAQAGTAVGASEEVARLRQLVSARPFAAA